MIETLRRPGTRERGQASAHSRASGSTRSFLSTHYMVPGVLALVLVVTTTIATSLSIVREREVARWSSSWSRPPGMGAPGRQMIPLGILALLDAAIILAVIRFWFRVPMLGSPGLVLICVLGLMLNTLGTGLLISTISRTQQEAQLTAFLLVNPSILLSGFIFPVENVLALLRPLSYAIATTHFLKAERAIFPPGR